MTSSSCFRFDGAALFEQPFPFFARAFFLTQSVADPLLRWLETGAPWDHRRARCHHDATEFDLDRVETLDPNLAFLSGTATLEHLREKVRLYFHGLPSGPMRASVRRLVAPGEVAVATRFGDGAPAMELVIHLNRGCSLEGGGALVLLDADHLGQRARTHRSFLPLHRSAVCFPKSPRSFHGTTRLLRGEQYALVYSFHDHALPVSVGPRTLADFEIPPTLRSGELPAPTSMAC